MTHEAHQPARRNPAALEVLVVSACFPPAWSWGGQPRSVWNMCRGLASAGADVHVVTTNADLEGRVEVPRQRVEEGVTITTAPVLPVGGGIATRYGLAPSFAADLWRAAGRADICVLQGIWTFPLAVGPRICRLRNLPYVVVPRGTLEAISLSEKAAKKDFYFRMVEAGNLRGAAAVQFTSEAELQNSRQAIGDAETLLHPNAIELAKQMPRHGRELRASLGLDDEAILVGISGRLHPRKGFEVIVPALAQAETRVELVSFGPDEADYRRKIVECARECGVADRVHFLGHLEGEELQSAYASVDLQVLPSHGESFGNTAIEALGQGTEVLLSDRVPLGPWVERQGVGAVVAGLEPEAWGRALDAWAARRDGFDHERARTSVREEFDFRKSGERLLRAYQRLLEAPVHAPAPANPRKVS